MQCLNEDVESKTPVKFNLSLPRVLMEKFEATVERYGSRHKGDAIAAAVLLFLQLESGERDRRVGEIVTAKLTGKVESLLKEPAPTDDIAPVLHPHRPEQLLSKPRRKRTG